ncbi:hypothetical protein FOZ63_027519, partial [Perkinsus olseni]
MSTRSSSYPLLTGLSSIHKAPKWSIRGRGPSSLVNSEAGSMPGPGTYASERVSAVVSRFTSSPQFGFGTASRDPFGGRKRGRAAVPGPGAYTPNNADMLSTAKYAFGRSCRRSIADGRSGTPGPGAYSPSCSLGGP